MKDSTLTEEELKKLKHKAFDALSAARHALLSKYPFIGSIALHMDLIPVRDVRVRTACTDGSNVYFDIAFLSSLSNDERIFVLAHEIWHAVLLHLTRRGTRDSQLFNIATDKEVNYLLKSDGLVPPDNLCFPERDEIGKCAEEIYEMMLKKAKNQQKSRNAGKSGNSNGKNNNGGQPSKNDDSSGNKDGKLSGQFDKHIYDGDEPDKSNGESSKSEANDGFNGPAQITDKYGTVGVDSDFNPHVQKGFADRMRETVIAEAQRVEKMKGQGSVPDHVKELVKKMTNAELPWQEILAQFVTKCYNSGNRSWIPPNRRHVHNGVYLQSRQATKLKAAVAIDTSGSTYSDRTKFLSELNSLVNSFGMYELTVICCDAQVDSCKTFTQDDPLNIEMDGFEMSGGGGTSFVPPFDYVLDNQIQCDCFIYLTDGWGPAPEKNPLGIPVLWIITKDGTEDFCDWGQKIHLKQNDNDIN